MASVVVSGLLVAERPLDATERGILVDTPVWSFDLLTSVPVTALPAGRVASGTLAASRIASTTLTASRRASTVLSAGRSDQ